MFSHFLRLCGLGLTLGLGACANPSKIPLGASEQQVLQQLGAPSAIHADGADKILEYNSWPHGQQTWMVRLGANGAVLSFTQSMDQAQFARLRLQQSTREQALRLLGQPYEKVWFERIEQEVWSYPYRESGVWDSMMHLYFDRAGVLQKMENGPDDRIERQERMMRRLFRQ